MQELRSSQVTLAGFESLHSYVLHFAFALFEFHV